MLEINWLEAIKIFRETSWEIIKSLWWMWGIILVFLLIEIFFQWFGKWLEKQRVKKWLEKHKTLEDWKK